MVCSFVVIAETRDRALLAFSLRRSWDALVSHQKDDLPVIHGVRSVFTVLLFAAHKLMPLALTPYSNRGLLTQVGKCRTIHPYSYHGLLSKLR